MSSIDKIIIGVNSWQSRELEGMYDVYRIQHLPNHTPALINALGDRIGTPYTDINLNKVVAVVETDVSDRSFPFRLLDRTSEAIASHFPDFLEDEVRVGRLTYDQYTTQSSVGSVLSTVMTGLLDSKLENIKAYTEVAQDGTIDLIDASRMAVVSAISFFLSLEVAERMSNEVIRYRESIILRPQQISNHPEVVRRIDLIATNGMTEVDIYGDVNSTHTNGSCMMNGIGGSGDFTCNAFVSSFISPSLAKDSAIPTTVPLASHTDHTEHDAMVIIIERGFIDLRDLVPRDRVAEVISTVHLEYQPLPEEYYERTSKTVLGMSTPYGLRIVFDPHVSMIKKGSMKG